MAEDFGDADDRDFGIVGDDVDACGDEPVVYLVEVGPGGDGDAVVVDRAATAFKEGSNGGAGVRR